MLPNNPVQTDDSTPPAPAPNPPSPPPPESLEEPVSFVQKLGRSSAAKVAVFGLVFAGIGGAIIYSSFAADNHSAPIKKALPTNLIKKISQNDQFTVSLPSGWTADICQQGTTTNVSIGEKLYPSGQTNSGHCNSGGKVFVSTTQLVNIIAVPDKTHPLAQVMRSNARGQVAFMNPVTVLEAQADYQVKLGKCKLKQTDTKALVSGKKMFRSFLDYGACGQETTYQYYPYTSLSKKGGTTSFYAAYFKQSADANLAGNFDQIIGTVVIK